MAQPDRRRPVRTPGAPPWAQELVNAVCADAGVSEPVLGWRRAARPNSSGVTRRAAGRVSVTAGTDPLDARLTLLHELAHWLTAPPAGMARRPARGRQRSVHHGRAFYSVAFRLYLRHGLTTDDALRREAARYPGSLRHAAALGVPGAAAALRVRLAALRARSRGGWRVLVPEHPVRLARDGRWWVCHTCGQRIVARALVRALRRPGRERHVLWSRVAP
jgi:hypothetical protein